VPLYELIFSVNHGKRLEDKHERLQPQLNFTLLKEVGISWRKESTLTYGFETFRVIIRPSKTLIVILLFL